MRSLMFRMLLVLPLIAASVPARAAGPAAAEPTITFSTNTVTISGVTHGTSVLIFGYGLEPLYYESRSVRWTSTVDDADHDGVVVFDAKAAIPLRSVWIIADQTSGDFAVATPTGFALNRRDLKGESLRRAADGASAFDFERTPVTMVYVLPGNRGAWVLREEDGGPTDADGSVNGHTVLAIRHGKPLAGPAPPAAFAPGGILVLLDESNFEVRAARLTPALLEGAR